MVAAHHRGCAPFRWVSIGIALLLLLVVPNAEAALSNLRILPDQRLTTNTRVYVRLQRSGCTPDTGYVITRQDAVTRIHYDGGLVGCGVALPSSDFDLELGRLPAGYAFVEVVESAARDAPILLSSWVSVFQASPGPILVSPNPAVAGEPVVARFGASNCDRYEAVRDRAEVRIQASPPVFRPPCFAYPVMFTLELGTFPPGTYLVHAPDGERPGDPSVNQVMLQVQALAPQNIPATPDARWLAALVLLMTLVAALRAWRR